MSVLPLLAASSPERAVWLSFGFYLLNVLVPIVPAVIIYWLFPEGKAGTQSSVDGSMGGWKIKAVGAWGAYVTAFLLGFWAVRTTTSPLIKAVAGGSVWTIQSEFKLTDENGKDIYDATLDKLRVLPPMIAPFGKRATITLTSLTLDPPDEIQMSLEGYEPKTVDLRHVPREEGKIHLSMITLKRLPLPNNSLPAPRPLPAETGPAPLTVNK